TIDTWLLWRLTGGAEHRTDYSNASRTMLYNIFRREWDPLLLERIRVPWELLPQVGPSSAIHGVTRETDLPDGSTLPAGIPIAGIAGDQQSALFGQAGFEN